MQGAGVGASHADPVPLEVADQLVGVGPGVPIDPHGGQGVGVGLGHRGGQALELIDVDPRGHPLRIRPDGDGASLSARPLPRKAVIVRGRFDGQQIVAGPGRLRSAMSVQPGVASVTGKSEQHE